MLIPNHYKRRVIAACAGLLLFLGGPAAAQEAGVYGRVTDATGDALPGATIAVANAETGLQRTVTTRRRRAIPGPLAAGRGPIPSTASLQGFQTVTNEGLRLQVGQGVTLNISLELAGVEESVTVTAVAPLIESRQADYSTIITEEQVGDPADAKTASGSIWPRSVRRPARTPSGAFSITM